MSSSPSCAACWSGICSFVSRRIEPLLPLARSRGPFVLIQISRAVRLTLSESELKTFNSGEIYEVPPAIGRVLVSDGWAFEVISERRGIWTDTATADDNPSDRQPNS